MKLVMAIINHDDAHLVISRLTKEGISVTKLATTGGFLRSGNVTILVGVDEDRVPETIELIREHSKSRVEPMPTATGFGMGMFPTMPVDVRVGGATIFVLNVERFEKL